MTETRTGDVETPGVSREVLRPEDEPMTTAGRLFLDVLRDHAPWFVGGSRLSEYQYVRAIEKEAAGEARRLVLAEVG